MPARQERPLPDSEMEIDSQAPPAYYLPTTLGRGAAWRELQWRDPN